jgi:hypothetical protein
MSRRKKTDGERIAKRMAENWAMSGAHVAGTAREIDRIIRKRQREAWKAGYNFREVIAEMGDGR